MSETVTEVDVRDVVDLAVYHVEQDECGYCVYCKHGTALIRAIGDNLPLECWNDIEGTLTVLNSLSVDLMDEDADTE